LPTRRHLLICPSPSHPQNALCLFPRSIPLLSSRRGLQPCLLSLKTTRSALLKLIRLQCHLPSTGLPLARDHHYFDQPASQHIQLCFFYTSVQLKLQHVCQHTIEFMCRVSRDCAGSDARCHITCLLQKHLPPLPLPLHLLRRVLPCLTPAQPSPALSHHFSFPSHFVSQSQTATGHTSKRTDSSSI